MSLFMKTTGPDKFPLAEEDPLKREHEVLSQLLDDLRGAKYNYALNLEWCDTGARIAKQSNVQLRRLLLATVPRLLHSKNNKTREFVLIRIQIWLLAQRIELREDDLLLLTSGLLSCEATWRQRPTKEVVDAILIYVSQHEISGRLRGALEELLDRLESEFYHWVKEEIDKLRSVLDLEPLIRLSPRETWSIAATRFISRNDLHRSQWTRLMQHCAGALSSKPSGKWLREAGALVRAVGHAGFRDTALDWFLLVDKPNTESIDSLSSSEEGLAFASETNVPPQNPNLLEDFSQTILKGLVWCCSLIEDIEITRSLTPLAISAYRKIPGIGPRAPRIGNACVWALGVMPGMESVAQLAILKVRVKNGSAQKGIEKSLVAAAEREGLAREELEEMAVPTYGLTSVGEAEESIGGFAACLRVTGTSSTSLTWRKANGKEQKSVPAVVKQDFAEDLKEVRLAAKEIQKMLPVQRERLDNLFLEQKRWPLGTWRDRYLDHPLVGTLARRLIWRFHMGEETRDAIWWKDGFVEASGRSLDVSPNEAEVELWHPVGAAMESIQNWRAWLTEHQTQQPFKQAHREVYLLTDAERNTSVYSNRFAAHVVRQHQFNALCGQRGWKNQLRLMVDDEYAPPTKLLPNWNLRAEFWIEGIGEEFGVDTNDVGTYLYLTTDQVRFYPINAAQARGYATGGGYYYYGEQVDEPVQLDQVPAMVFTEIMRDVDLFVGVGSVGNDPGWADGGPEGRHIDYWNSYSFGDLAESAETRKQVLEHLLPRLRISDRCELADRFLKVRGELRTYKIHLGSGSILMEPNDQYLCIVMARGEASKGESGKVFLPFEGDNTLSIILSKAFILAEDAKIKDQTILNQIRSPRLL